MRATVIPSRGTAMGKDPASSKSRSGILTGFGVGLLLVAASSGIQVFLGQRIISGWQWIDLIVEAAIGGLVGGAIGGWVSRPRK
jgi:hypothetical protein